jgi:UPF0755 protein
MTEQDPGSRRSPWRIVKRLLWAAMGLTLVATTTLGGLAYVWLNAPLVLRSEHVELSIEPGTSVRAIAQAWVTAGVEEPEEWLYQWFRWSGQSRQIRAGSYEIDEQTTPRELLARMVRGDQTLQTVRFIEGWTFRQVRAALLKASHLRPTLQDMSDEQIAALLGFQDGHIEGWIFPDTYAYSRGVSDLTVLRRAVATMQRHVEATWQDRREDVPLRSAYELLVLASIVEKETGLPSDRGRIAGVFTNRLKAGMPLQSDPTVIYGLGSDFDGNLRKIDLQTDTPWNTYTRRGLPPTPIAMPGLQALRAVARPDPTPALYFVARGDGSSEFSNTLIEHNRAVNQYQRGSP